MITSNEVTGRAKEDGATKLDDEVVGTCGTWQHLTSPIRESTEQVFADGLELESSCIHQGRDLSLISRKVIPCTDLALDVEEVTELKILNRPTETLENGQSQAEPHSDEPVEDPRNSAVGSTVLIIAPDAELRTLVRVGLEERGVKVLEADSGTKGIEAAIRERPRAVLLDMDVEGPGGMEVIERLREWSQIPILALSGRAEASEAVRVLDHGANDYIAKPFNLEEVSARLRAAQRFAPPCPPEIFKSGSLRVNLTNRTVQVGNSAVNLSATEYSLLRLFVRHAGKVLTHAHILSEVWGSEMRNQVNYLRVYLRFLRKKLENPFEPSLFITQRAVGYGIAIRE